jgi:hypothetical protein
MCAGDSRADVQLLLDTHAVLWWQADDRRLSAAARAAIATTLVTRDAPLGGYGVPRAVVNAGP